MKLLCPAIFLLLIASPVLTVNAQQVPADTSLLPQIADPAYSRGGGPVICVDSAHNNFHTAESGFAPFAAFLGRDGYRIRTVDQKFERKSTAVCDLIVIANALHAENSGNWTLPTLPAFSEAEIAHLESWVESGGSLFLIADHMPFPGAAADLAGTFGFTFNNGFALKQVQSWPPAVFTKTDGTLAETPVTADVDSVASYTGQAFLVPEEAVPVLVFGNDHFTLMPDTAWQFNPETPQHSVEGWSQGALLIYGSGRLAVFGEAAMFTAQVAGTSRQQVGLTDPAAPQNARLLRNLIRWLDIRD